MDATDWDSACDAVSVAYFPHELRPLHNKATTTGLDVCITPLGPLRIVRIGWGAEVSINTDHAGAYAVNVPLHGVLETNVVGRPVVSTQGLATVNPPDTPVSITRWSSSCTILGVKIDRDYLQQELWKVAGRPDVAIPGQLDLRTDAGSSWLRLVRSVAGQPGDDPVLSNPLVAQQLAGTLTDAFLIAALPEAADDAHAPRPRIVTRVLDAFHADPARPWTAADMAATAGISVRRLQEGFRQYVGKTPRECLTEIRLTGVYGELQSGAVSSVTDAALRWGFTHFGRFAAAFRDRYGIAPSELLRG